MYQRVSQPIDVIYTSSIIQVSAGNYPPFGIIPSDHRLLWINNEFDYTVGAETDTLVPNTTRSLNYQKTNTIKHFIELYKKLIRENGLNSELLSLQERLFHELFKTLLQTKYDRLQNNRDDILQTESKWRKLKMGEVPWSRLLQESMDTILLCRVVLSRKKGSRISTRYITRLKIWFTIHNSLHPYIVQVENHLTIAYRRYHELKKDALNLR